MRVVKEDTVLNESSKYFKGSVKERYDKCGFDKAGLSLEEYKEWEDAIVDLLNGNTSTPKRLNSKYAGYLKGDIS